MQPEPDVLPALQAALWAFLEASTAITDVGVTGVHDHVPGDDDPDGPAAYPYIELGEWTTTPDLEATRWGRRNVTTLHSWSAHHGNLEVLAINGAIIAELHKRPDQLQLPGDHRVTRIALLQATTVGSGDPDIRHGVVRLAIHTDHPITN